MKNEDTKMEKSTQFVSGAEYRLYCKNGKEGKRTATFVKWLNSKMGLIRIGNKYKAVEIITSEDGTQYTKLGLSRDIFGQYLNICSKERV